MLLEHGTDVCAFSIQTHDTYTLTVKGTDMNGAPNGNTGMGEVVISILDVNDNIPTLEKSVVRCFCVITNPKPMHQTCHKCG